MRTIIRYGGGDNNTTIPQITSNRADVKITKAPELSKQKGSRPTSRFSNQRRHRQKYKTAAPTEDKLANNRDKHEMDRQPRLGKKNVDIGLRNQTSDCSHNINVNGQHLPLDRLVSPMDEEGSRPTVWKALERGTHKSYRQNAILVNQERLRQSIWDIA